MWCSEFNSTLELVFFFEARIRCVKIDEATR